MQSPLAALWRWRLLLCLALFLPTAQGGSQGQEVDEQAQVSVTQFSGEEIPDFFMWRDFFKRIDYRYRLGLGFYKYWVNTTLNLRPLLAKDPKFAHKFVQQLADCGTIVDRATERLQNEKRMLEKMRKLGEITPEQKHTSYLAYTRQEVQFVQAQQEELHRTLTANENGPAIWAIIVNHVHKAREHMVVTRENTPKDLDAWEIILEFKEVEQ